jgi:energy-coupling factor transporter ATP-binding protein EcfA2
VNKLPLNININKEDQLLNEYLFCWHKFQSMPNKVILYNVYLSNDFIEKLEKYKIDLNIATEIFSTFDSPIINDKILSKISDDIFISYVILDKNSENSVVDEVTIFYKNIEDVGKINDIIEIISDSIISPDKNEQESKLNIICLNQGELNIESLSSESNFESIEYYYNKKTFKKTKEVIKKIKKEKKGLYILYGQRGCGKTTIINYISSKVEKNIIFIPGNMIEHTINNPDFRNFLKNYPDSILLIDDCELIFNKIYNRSNISTNNLIQLVDGFLSKIVNIDIMAIFNINDESEIDPNLLECNSLIDIVEFEPLNSTESTELSEIIGHNRKYKSEQKLINIIRNIKQHSKFDIGF